MKIALGFVRIRVEERLLIDAFEEIGVPVTPIDLRSVVLAPPALGQFAEFDVFVDRSLSLTSSITTVRVLESMGVRCVNSGDAIEVCADKMRTTLALQVAGVPTPDIRVATSPEAALEAIESLGYPCVLKPTVGSWGRLVARVNDRDAAEAIIEHRDTLGSVNHSVYYVQEFIDKPGRDLRVFVVGGRAIAAIVRTSDHWVTNTARGAKAANYALTPDISSMCQAAVEAVGADVAAVDVLECPRRGPMINELNHSMEFRNSIDTTGVNIPRLVAEHVVRIAQSLPARTGVSA